VMKTILSDLRARGFVIRKRGDLWAVRGVWPERLTAHALEVLWRSGARKAGA
jgi:hypothetical protein